MQRKLRSPVSAMAGIALLTLLATGASATSDSSSSRETKLRWVSPSRTTTPKDFQNKSSKSSNKTSSSSNKRIVRTWKTPSNQSNHGARTAPLPKTKEVRTSQPSPRATSITKKQDQVDKWIDRDDIDLKAAEQTETAAAPSPTQEPQVARRLFRNRAPAIEQQRSALPHMERMHPTERQVDDRRRAKEPPVEKLPIPSRELDEADKDSSNTKLKPLTNSQKRMRTKVRRVLAHYYNRPLNTGDRSPWEIMHCSLAYEVHSKVRRGSPQGEPVTAIGWLCFNQPCKKRTLMYINDEGELRVRVGPALQGHRGQLLAMLAWSNVSKDYPMRVEGHDLTITDLVEMEKRTCFPKSELTFKLIGLMHYLPSDARWTNEQGMEWNLPKMIYEESRQSLRDAACGGTHRLTGLTLAYKTREERGEPVDGAYLRAKQYVTKYKNYAYRLQNSDGSFSTEWFRGPGNEESLDRKLKTTGHILEWLLYAAEERDLQSPRIHRAANYLANIMYNNRNKDWEAGPLGHAIHALFLYDRLMFAPHDAEDVLPMASTPNNNSNRRNNSRGSYQSRSSRSKSSRYRQSSNSRMRR